MSEQFLNFSREKKRAILEGVESSLGIKPYFLEKDIWICWVLKELFTLPKKMAFKGGTSLSKCFSLIDRFSEDVDVTIDYREFMPDLDLLNESKNALKNKREKLKNEVNDYIIKIVIPMFEMRFAAQFSNEKLNYKFEAGERLYIYYPSVFERNADDYVKDNVLIEFGGTNKTEPNEESIVKPYLNIDGLIVPTAKVSVYSPARTFWEKVTLIHVECHRGRLTDAPERLSRHWYDLAKLSQSWVKSNALQNKALLNDVLIVKKAFFNAGYANYDKCEKKAFRLIPNMDEIAKLKSDYAMMIESDMFLNEPVSFDEIMSEIENIQNVINQDY
jgi:hypothetical protein